MPVKCRLCHRETGRWVDRGDVALLVCRSCRFVSGVPSGVLSPEERYSGLYASSSPPSPETRYREWLTAGEALVGKGRLLEVGAGNGGFVRVAVARGWTVDATEVSTSGLEALRSTGAQVFAGDLMSARYPSFCFDLVASLEVLEHLPEPAEHLYEVWRVTRPGGLLLLTTPNFDGLSRRCMGVRWRVVDPEHLGYFTPSTLAPLLRRIGYVSVMIESRSLDVLSWRPRRGGGETARFDPHASARLRDAVEASPGLRLGKRMLNSVLRFTGLGDSLLVWARR